MRMLASAMAAAAGLGTAAGVALVARHADPGTDRRAPLTSGRPAATPTRTVLVIRPASPTPRKPKQHKGERHGGNRGKGKGNGRGKGDGNDEGDGG